MKLCANISLLFTEYPLSDRIKAAAGQGFEGVEIQFPYDTFPTIQAAKTLREALDETALPLALINMPVGDLMAGGDGLASHPKRRDAFKYAVDQCIAYTELLGVKQVNVLAGKTTDEFHEEHHYDVFLENLNYCADTLGSIGITTLFEAINTCDMPNFLIHSTAQMQQVVQDLNHRHIALLYDVYHMSRMGEPVVEQLPDLLDQIGHIQFADIPDRNEPGTGDLAFNEVISLLAQKGYANWLSAEYKPTVNTDSSLKWMASFYDITREHHATQ